MSDIVRVLRIIEYVGPREWVEKTVAESIHGTKHLNLSCSIRAATIGEYPEILYPDHPDRKPPKKGVET